MKITRKNPFTGQENTLDLPITLRQYDAYMNGALAQRAFPDLTPDQREFIISGIPPGELERNFALKVPKEAFGPGAAEEGDLLVAFASDLGWEVGWWPELIKFDDGKDFIVFERASEFYTEATTHEDREFGGCFYKSLDGSRAMKIFND